MNIEHLLQIRDNLQISLKLIDDQLINQLNWRLWAARGESFLAIKAYRQEHPGTGISEAKSVVDSFREMIR